MGGRVHVGHCVVSHHKCGALPDTGPYLRSVWLQGPWPVNKKRQFLPELSPIRWRYSTVLRTVAVHYCIRWRYSTAYGGGTVQCYIRWRYSAVLHTVAVHFWILQVISTMTWLYSLAHTERTGWVTYANRAECRLGLVYFAKILWRFVLLRTWGKEYFVNVLTHKVNLPVLFHVSLFTLPCVVVYSSMCCFVYAFTCL